MHFRKFFMAIALAAVLILIGCGSESDSGDGQHKVNYAKVYNPDGTLLAEGEYDSCWVSSSYVTLRINGVKYQTGYQNVVTMWWYEEVQQ